LLLSGAFAGMLAGCGGSQPPIGAAGAMLQNRFGEGTNRATAYDATKALLFVVNFTYGYDGDVAVYSAKARNPSPIASITDGIDGPDGDCIDSNGTLYVTNDPINGLGWVSEYPLGKLQPSVVITSGVSTPAFCAIDSKNNLWVTNIGGRNVTEYLHDSSKPHTVITQGMVYPVGIAFDRFGNLYVANRLESYTGDVIVFAAGTTTPSRTITDGVNDPVAIAIAEDGALYVTDEHDANVKEYRYESSEPYRTFRRGITRPGGLAIGRNGLLYVSNFLESNVVELAPKSGRLLRRQISNGLAAPIGMAYFAG
jgi:serine/threonine-protein kinase